MHDSIASANNGTAANTSWTSGRFGGALSFNGTSSWVTVPDSSALDLTKAFTLEAWVKPAVGMGTNWETIVFKESLLGAVYALYANSDSGDPAGRGKRRRARRARPDRAAGGRLGARRDHVGRLDHAPLRQRHAGRDAQRGRHAAASIGVLHIGGNSTSRRVVQGPDRRGPNLQPGSGAEPHHRRHDDLDNAVGSSRRCTPPSAPTGLAATNVATTSVTVNWTASTDNVGVAGYNLFSDGVAAGTATAPVTTFLNLSCGASHTFGVEAFDAAGNVSPRTSVTVSTLSCPDTAAPSAPAAFAAGATTTSSIATSWAASSDNVGVAGYTLYKDGIAAGTATGTSFAFTGLLCGTTYTLGVEAFDAAGNVSARSTLVKSTSACPDVTAPSAPTSFVPGTTGTTSIATSWVASTDNVGVAGYTLYRNGVSAGTATSPLFTFAGLTCGTSYTLGVEAFDAAGNVSTRTSITASTSVCPDVTPPSAPSALATGSVTRTSLVFSWTGSTDNVGVAGYRIFRDGVSAGTSATPSFSFSTLTCGTSYVLGVEAFDAAGNTSTRPAITATTSACADTTPPTAPSALAAGSVTRTSLVLSWTGSSDNVGVAGYRIFRDGVSTGTSATPSFSFSTLTCGTSYVLGVEAFDAAGNMSTRPAITATTSACADTTPPSAPASFSAGTTGTTSIATSWAASTDNVGVTGYTLYRNGVERRDGDVAAVHVCGAHVRDELHAGRRGVRRGGQRVAAHLDHGVDLGLPRRDGAFRAGLVLRGHDRLDVDRDLVGRLDGQRRRQRVHALSQRRQRRTATSPLFTFAGLTCGTGYTLGVEAFDAAGNVSARTSITASTTACPDVDGAFRAERARGRHRHRSHGAGHLDGIDGQRRRRGLPALP